MRSQKVSVKDLWENLGSSNSNGKLVTHRDVEQVNLEIYTIMKYLRGSDRVMDMGCGTGFSTAFYARACKQVIGLDYAKSMIESAKKCYKAKNLEFHQQNVLNLGDQFSRFSTIITTRCLINLNSWNQQKKAIENLHSRIGKGGQLILVEGSKQGREELNKLRVSVGLPKMPKVWHNIDFDEKRLLPFLKNFFRIEEIKRLGLYDVLTRVHYPLSIKPKSPKYGTAYHAAAREIYLKSVKDPYPQYSREFIMVLRKK